MKEYDVIVIGAGPSGLTTAVYLARGGLKCAILERNYPGGQMLETNEIENYPGYTTIAGYDLANNMLDQVTSLGVDIIYDEGEVDLEKLTITADGIQISTKAIVIATGATHKNLGIDTEATFKGRGVSYCATCDGAFYKGKTVAVIGGGNTALQDALYLAKGATVHLVHRREQFRGSNLLVERVKNSGVNIHTPYTVKSINGGEKVESITITHRDTGKDKTIPVDGIFVAVGQTPSTDSFNLQKDDFGYIVTDDKMKTSIPNIWAVGDCRAKTLRQIITACSDGAIAGEDIIEQLSK